MVVFWAPSILPMSASNTPLSRIERVAFVVTVPSETSFPVVTIVISSVAFSNGIAIEATWMLIRSACLTVSSLTPVLMPSKCSTCSTISTPPSISLVPGRLSPLILPRTSKRTVPAPAAMALGARSILPATVPLIVLLPFWVTKPLEPSSVRKSPPTVKLMSPFVATTLLPAAVSVMSEPLLRSTVPRLVLRLPPSSMVNSSTAETVMLPRLAVTAPSTRRSEAGAVPAIATFPPVLVTAAVTPTVP